MHTITLFWVIIMVYNTRAWCACDTCVVRAHLSRPYFQNNVQSDIMWQKKLYTDNLLISLTTFNNGGRFTKILKITIHTWDTTSTIVCQQTIVTTKHLATLRVSYVRKHS